jgi:hypothetical protein
LGDAGVKLPVALIVSDANKAARAAAACVAGLPLRTAFGSPAT